MTASRLLEWRLDLGGARCRRPSAPGGEGPTAALGALSKSALSASGGGCRVSPGERAGEPDSRGQIRRRPRMPGRGPPGWRRARPGSPPAASRGRLEPGLLASRMNSRKRSICAAVGSRPPSLSRSMVPSVVLIIPAASPLDSGGTAPSPVGSFTVSTTPSPSPWSSSPGMSGPTDSCPAARARATPETASTRNPNTSGGRPPPGRRRGPRAAQRE